MLDWLYHLPLVVMAGVTVVLAVSIASGGFALVHWLVLPRFRYHDGVNDAVSGAVQAIGVFYGITVGLIAVGVWNNYSKAKDITSHEAATVATLYLTVSGFAEPERTALRDIIRDYLTTIIEDVWPAQRVGERSRDWPKVERLRNVLMSVEPQTEGLKAQYSTTLELFGQLVEQRRLRVDATAGRLSIVMWGVIIVGAALSIGVMYLFKLEDVKLHATIIVLSSAFLGIVFFMILVYDRPFFGVTAIEPESYRQVQSAIARRPPT